MKLRVDRTGLFAAGVLLLPLFAATLPDPATDYSRLVRTLADPSMKGRGTGSPQLERAAHFIEGEFKKLGLKPVNGSSYFQRYTVTTKAHLGKKNAFRVMVAGATETLKPQTDFQPYNFSGTGTISGPVVFAGYGITAPEYHYDDYEGLDVKDKIVLVLRHEPQEFNEKSVFEGKVYTRHAQIDSKGINAKFHGARAVLFVNDRPAHTNNGPETLDPFSPSVGPGSPGIPFVQIKYETAETWLGRNHQSLKTWIEAVDRDLKPNSFALNGPVQIDLTVDVIRDHKDVPNVCAYLPGETDEYVIIGAHFDHLGMGEQFSMDPAHAGKLVHPGADDNASGTAGVLELARWLSAEPKHKRGFLFLAFSGEELGLLGSAYYANHPLLPLDKAVAMINLDMIGRVQNGRVYVSGAGTGSTLKALLEEAKAKSKLELDFSDQGGYGSSDHTSFTAKQMPVLFFFSGLHKDYHRPTDTSDKIESGKAVEVLQVVNFLATHLSDTPQRPQFVRTVDHSNTAVASGAGSGYGPYFGSVPDMSEVPEGFRLADVRDGSPAALAGLQGGDVLFEFDGKPISNLMDFTYALRAHKPGDQVTVKWRRNGKEMSGSTVLKARK